MVETNAAVVSEGMASTTLEPVYDMAVRQFRSAADRLGIDEGTCRILSQPKRELTVHFPVKMDNGDVQVLTGYRVQHNLFRGPGKGGRDTIPPGR